MGPIISLVDNATSNIMPSGGPLPSALLYSAHLLNRLHWLWCWHVQYVTVYANSGNFKKYMAGCLLNAVAGNSDLLRGAALVVLITRRILDCGKQKVAVYRAWTDVVKAWHVDYSRQVRVHLSRSLANANFLEQMVDEQTYIWIRKTQQGAVLCLLQIGHQLRLLFWELLQLSVCYRLVIEAASLNPNVRTAAVNELLLHTSEIFEDISKNRRVIHTELLNNKKLIQQIINTIGINASADTLINGVGKGLSIAETAYTTTNNVYFVIEDTVKRGLGFAWRSTVG